MNPNKILHFYAVNPNKILHFYAVNPNQILDLYAVSPNRIIYLYRGKPLFAHFSYRRSMLTKLPSALSSRLTAYKIYPWSWADDEREQNKKSVTGNKSPEGYLYKCLTGPGESLFSLLYIISIQPLADLHIPNYFPDFHPGQSNMYTNILPVKKKTMKTSSRIINEISKDIQCR